MTVRDIVRAYLKDNGYAGLAGDECGCSLDDLAPCECDPLDCEPADLHKCAAVQECSQGLYCTAHECYRARPETGKEKPR